MSVAAIGDDDVARIEVLGLHAEVAEGEGDDEARETLAVARDGVDGAGSEFAEDGEPFDEFGEFLEMLVEEAVERGALGERHDEARFARVHVAKIVELADVLGARAVNGCGGDGEQLIGGFAHGGDDNHGTTSCARFDDSGDAFDGGGGFDRTAAEFHDDHQSSIPSECISSALRTAAPAAPRMVLWPRATNL